MHIDSTGTSNASIDTLADLGVTTTSRTTTQYKTATSEEHADTVDSALAEYAENAMVLNIDDYHSIHTKRTPNTTTTSTAAHLATVLMNPITTQSAISKMNIHNPALVDAELIKMNVATRFMVPYGLSHNQRWGFRTVDENTTRLKEKRSTRSMKDVILVDLQENNLHSLDAYLKAINVIVNVTGKINV
jgi:hypothetical protein